MYSVVQLSVRNGFPVWLLRVPDLDSFEIEVLRDPYVVPPCYHDGLNAILSLLNQPVVQGLAVHYGLFLIDLVIFHSYYSFPALMAHRPNTWRNGTTRRSSPGRRALS